MKCSWRWQNSPLTKFSIALRELVKAARFTQFAPPVPAKVAAYKGQPADKLKLQTLITRRVALVEHKRVWCATSAYGQGDALPEAVKTACRQADYATGGRESHTLQESNRLVTKGCKIKSPDGLRARRASWHGALRWATGRAKARSMGSIESVEVNSEGGLG